MASKFTVGTPNTLEKAWNSDIEIEYRKLLATCFKTLNRNKGIITEGLSGQLKINDARHPRVCLRKIKTHD